MASPDASLRNDIFGEYANAGIAHTCFLRVEYDSHPQRSGENKGDVAPAGEDALQSVRIDLVVRIICCAVFLSAMFLYLWVLTTQIWKRKKWTEEQMLTIVFMLAVWSLRCQPGRHWI